MSKILIIEDDMNIRKTIRNILEFKSYEVVEAANGKEGVYKALSDNVDLIVCDIMMPEKDGYEVLKIIKGKAGLNGVPFIFLTAKAESSDLRKGMEMGADDYIFKPFSAEDVLKSIQVRLDKNNARKKELDERVNQLINQLNATSAHEYNTALNGIIGLSEILLMNIENYDRGRVKHFLKGINTAGYRLKKGLDNVLYYHDIIEWQNNKEKQEELFTGKHTLFQDVVFKKAQKVAKNHEREDDLHLKIETANIPVPDSYFEKILSELLDNSFQFSKPGSKVKITGKKIDQGYSLALENRGDGLVPGDIGKIGPYKNFRKSEVSVGGNGLGLFIAKRLVEFSGGKLEIDGGDGKVIVRAIFQETVQNFVSKLNKN